MLEGYSLRKCADLLGVKHVTLFYWRHKILSALEKMPIESFEGIVEMDETYMLYSRKVVQDRQKNTFTLALCRGRIKTPLLEQAVGDKISASNTLCTDGWRAFSTFAKKYGTEHYRFASTCKRRVIKEIYHIQNVNSFHGRFKKWLDHFNGVASKYLNHYSSWFRYLDANGADVTTSNMLVGHCLLVGVNRDV